MSHACAGMKYALDNHFIEPRIAVTPPKRGTRINRMQVIGYTLDSGKKGIAPILILFCPFCGLSLETEKEQAQ